MELELLRKEIKSLVNPLKAEILQRFFKTGKGEYGEGDVFLGLTVPECRKIAVKYEALSLREIGSVLNSKIHEERLIALLILVHNYQNHPLKKEAIFRFYLNNTKFINNWDLVDLSAHKILGNHLIDKDKLILLNLAKSNNMWERRISIISTYYFIKNNKFEYSLKIAEILINDPHDLIHKAVGWMLREIGNRDLEMEQRFLKKHYLNMPRTMLRYAIERFPENLRQKYLKGAI
ncbi:MAG: DNA alkylation repair protein [Nanoarchaeota archaeon]|nr:DNA alkylation repair protein [Nanoarchaeota archaeon]